MKVKSAAEIATERAASYGCKKPALVDSTAPVVLDITEHEGQKAEALAAESNEMSVEAVVVEPEDERLRTDLIFRARQENCAFVVLPTGEFETLTAESLERARTSIRLLNFCEQVLSHHKQEGEELLDVVGRLAVFHSRHKVEGHDAVFYVARKVETGAPRWFGDNSTVQDWRLNLGCERGPRQYKREQACSEAARIAREHGVDSVRVFRSVPLGVKVEARIDL